MRTRLLPPLLAALTLGLAPFAPEPHVIGKLRWVAGGAVGMAPMDWFDLLLHGAPWVWLAFALGLEVFRRGEPATRPGWRGWALGAALLLAALCVSVAVLR